MLVLYSFYYLTNYHFTRKVCFFPLSNTGVLTLFTQQGQVFVPLFWIGASSLSFRFIGLTYFTVFLFFSVSGSRGLSLEPRSICSQLYCSWQYCSSCSI